MASSCQPCTCKHRKPAQWPCRRAHMMPRRQSQNSRFHTCTCSPVGHVTAHARHPHADCTTRDSCRLCAGHKLYRTAACQTVLNMYSSPCCNQMCRMFPYAFCVYITVTSLSVPCRCWLQHCVHTAPRSASGHTVTKARRGIIVPILFCKMASFCLEHKAHFH